MAQAHMAAYGGLGGLFIAALALFRFLQGEKIWPWHAPGGATFKIWITMEIIRTGLGAGVAWVLAVGGPLSAFGAVVAGAGAPAIIDKWGSSTASKEISLPPVQDPTGLNANNQSAAIPTVGITPETPPNLANGGSNA